MAESSGAQQWDALPQRKRRGNRGGNEEAKRSREERKELATMPEINANLQDRAQQQRIQGSIHDKDGVASEYYEYLDHTADVQLHAWGANLEFAFERVVECMFNYMTDLSHVDIDPEEAIELSVEGHDMMSLLFNLLDEFLFKFSTDYFICKRAEVVSFDAQAFKLVVKGHGEIFDMAKHPQGTEIKAITYSNMQIHNEQDRADVFVIVDI